MAVDKKSQHVGNHGGAYTDNHGMRRQFTHIDYDLKTKIPVPTPIDKDEINFNLKQLRSRLVEKILSLPPSLAPDLFHDFREVVNNKFIWNQNMLLDEGLPLERLTSLKTLIENRMTLGNLI